MAAVSCLTWAQPVPNAEDPGSVLWYSFPGMKNQVPWFIMSISLFVYHLGWFCLGKLLGAFTQGGYRSLVLAAVMFLGSRHSRSKTNLVIHFSVSWEVLVNFLWTFLLDKRWFEWCRGWDSLSDTNHFTFSDTGKVASVRFSTRQCPNRWVMKYLRCTMCTM